MCSASCRRSFLGPTRTRCGRARSGPPEAAWQMLSWCACILANGRVGTRGDPIFWEGEKDGVQGAGHAHAAAALAKQRVVKIEKVCGVILHETNTGLPGSNAWWGLGGRESGWWTDLSLRMIPESRSNSRLAQVPKTHVDAPLAFDPVQAPGGRGATHAPPNSYM